ncbi:MAG TPA: type 4 pilus major pilin [Burkholderiaceae bacterium]|nr:type 4 pilus major pilin [Burkholderiaceae bacterium]
MNSTIRTINKQAGMTLMEILASLAILASVVVGALTLFGSAQSSQTSTQTAKDLISFRTTIQQLFTGQGGYGAVALNTTLNVTGRVPASFSYNAANTNFNTSWGGSLSITGTSSNFTMTLTEVTEDICIALVTGLSSGWKTVSVNGASASTFPVTLLAATTGAGACAASNTIIWTTTN